MTDTGRWGLVSATSVRRAYEKGKTMRTSWVGALWRAASALGRSRSVAEGEDPELAEESGFTLIELMVVLLIMGILMAIAIPTFLGVTNTANDRSTQSNLTNALTSAKALYAQANGWPATVSGKLQKAEPELKFVATTAASTTQKTVSVKAGTTTTNTTLYLAAWMTKTHLCWEIKDVQTGTTAGITYGFVGTTKTACKGGAAFKATTGNPTKKWPTPPAGH